MAQGAHRGRQSPPPPVPPGSGQQHRRCAVPSTYPCRLRVGPRQRPCKTRPSARIHAAVSYTHLASDSNGTVVDEAGFTKEKLARLIDIKERAHGRVADYAREFGLTYLEGQQPWSVPVDIALPCATQNELDADAARQLIANGVKAVAEGANMPTTIAATDLFLEAGVLFAPGKAANAGGVATSGLEMAQNAARMGWKAEKVDARLHHIMLDIHHACVQYGGEAKQTNYVRGANIAGFVKVADAMLAQGVI